MKENPPWRAGFLIKKQGTPATSSRPENVSVKIYDLRGHLVRDLGTRFFESGRHAVTWLGRDEQGQAAPSGVYFYQVETPSNRQTGKLTLVE